jgi:uncharacterized protein (TIGR03437 family)
LTFPNGVATDGAGNLYIADGAWVVRKVSPGGIITTVAGNHTYGYSGDGGPATSAQLGGPGGVAVDSSGNLYIVDGAYFVIRKVSPSGIISTVAGNGTEGYSGDGGPATSAQLGNFLESVAADGEGNLYIADNGNLRVRKVSASGGIITTVAGNGTFGYSGDGGPATSAQLKSAYGVAVDKAGNLYIADYLRLRKVSPGGTITTIAGNGVYGQSGNGGPATGAGLAGPGDVAVDGAGNVYTSVTAGVQILKPATQSVIISSVLDAASETAIAISPGKIVVIYGAGLGPATLVQNQPANGVFGTQAGGTAVSFNGIPAPMIYTSATQVAAIVPYGISGSPTAQVTVSYQGQASSSFPLPVAVSAPSFFSLNGTGAGQAAAVNVDGSLNSAANPVKIGGYVSLFATGEGQTSPSGVDGELASAQPYPKPLLPVSVTVGGLPAIVTYAGAAPTEVAGLMQVVVQIPAGVQPGGYVPVALQVGNASTVSGAAWIAVSGN